MNWNTKSRKKQILPYARCSRGKLSQCVFSSYMKLVPCKCFAHFKSVSIIVIAATHLHSFPTFEQSCFLFQEHRAREVKTSFPVLVLGTDVKAVSYTDGAGNRGSHIFLYACDIWGPLTQGARVEAVFPRANGQGTGMQGWGFSSHNMLLTTFSGFSSGSPLSVPVGLESLAPKEWKLVGISRVSKLIDSTV